MSSLVCGECGCGEIADDAVRGNKVCTRCGSVLAESAIVAEVGFSEGAGGSASVIGQFVASDGPAQFRIGGLGGAYSGRESREVTLNNGKRRIQEVASQLRLNQHCVDMAFNFFKMAVSKGITRGRRSAYVVAACLYMTCRLEGTPHLLLDFSDVLRVNIYDLGKTFSYLCRQLYVNVPPTDPCVYVLRFANCLKFGEKEHSVVMMALKLVGRMKRDWMAIGRRPTGVCGAALLLSARAHNFNRSIADIVRVVSIGESVLRKRLQEFSATPSSALTLDEFQSVELEEEADPPAFTEGKARERLKAERKREAAERARLAAEQALTSVSDELFFSTADQIEAIRSKGAAGKRSKDPAASSEGLPTALPKEALGLDGVDGVEGATSFLEEEVLEIAGLGETAKKLAEKAKEGKGSNYMDKYRAFAPTLQSMGLVKDPAALEEEEEGGEAGDGEPAAVEANESGELSLEGIDDDELDAYILNEPEVRMKTFLWMRHNGQFIKEREEKNRLKAELEEKQKAEGGGKKGKGKPVRRRKPPIQGRTAAEAMEKVVTEKKLSNKINYSVLASLGASPSKDAARDKDPAAKPAADETDASIEPATEAAPSTEPASAETPAEPRPSETVKESSSQSAPAAETAPDGSGEQSTKSPASPSKAPAKPARGKRRAAKPVLPNVKRKP